MSKRFFSYKPGSNEPLKKKPVNSFLPWNKEEDLKWENAQQALIYLIQLNESSPNNSFKVALKHQLYGVLESRTTVDREVSSLLECGEIKLFKTSLGDEQACVMFSNDYSELIKSTCLRSSNDSEKDKVVHRFLKSVLPNLKDLSISKDILIKKLGFEDADVTELIKLGILTVKNAGAWWLSIPNIGSFLKHLRKGRQTIIQTIKRSKYREMYQETLLLKKTLPSLKLSIMFLLNDLIGADIVQRTNSTTGILLRLREN